MIFYSNPNYYPSDYNPSYKHDKNEETITCNTIIIDVWMVFDYLQIKFEVFLFFFLSILLAHLVIILITMEDQSNIHIIVHHKYLTTINWVLWLLVKQSTALESWFTKKYGAFSLTYIWAFSQNKKEKKREFIWETKSERNLRAFEQR